MMPDEQYQSALKSLQHYTEQAAKVRSDAQAALLAKKKALKDGKKWLAGAHDTLMAWLKRQHNHLRVVLRQARALAVQWQQNLKSFERVHRQSVHLVAQYQLALRRIDLEEQLRRLRLSWRTYQVRHANGVASPDGHASDWEMSVKFGQLHRSLHALAHQQLYNGAPPAPPTDWLSILSADPTPKSSVPLSGPPLPSRSVTRRTRRLCTRRCSPPRPSTCRAQSRRITFSTHCTCRRVTWACTRIPRPTPTPT
jgi:hypothetical protein